MSSPWSTSGASAASRLLIERAHEEFVRGNPADPRLESVRSVVLESWRRSVEHLVLVDQLPPLDLTDEQLREYRRTHPLAGVIGMIRELLIPGDLGDSGVAVAVGDAAGRLLWVEGDRSVRTLTGEMGFVPGANWSEDAVGTSAPGTALTLDRSVQIRGAEHFNRLVQPWSCTAAPVHDPQTGRVLGVIDVTGGEQVVTPQAQLLVDAAARAVEGEILLSRLRARESAPPPRPSRRRAPVPTDTSARATLRVLGRDRGVLEVTGDGIETVTELSVRHAELLLMMATHRQGVSAERLGELLYGNPSASVTVRAEVVRLRKVLAKTAPFLRLDSRPYRLTPELETDAHQVMTLLDRGAHRVALAAYRGEVLPDSLAPGVEEVRDSVRRALREALMSEARVDVLLTYADTDAGAHDIELLRLCLELLPPRSPRRAGLVARVERLESPR